MKTCVTILAAAASLAATAALKPLFPINDEVITLVPAEQQRIMSLPTLAERLARPVCVGGRDGEVPVAGRKLVVPGRIPHKLLELLFLRNAGIAKDELSSVDLNILAVPVLTIFPVDWS